MRRLLLWIALGGALSCTGSTAPTSIGTDTAAVSALPRPIPWSEWKGPVLPEGDPVVLIAVEDETNPERFVAYAVLPGEERVAFAISGEKIGEFPELWREAAEETVNQGGSKACQVMLGQVPVPRPAPVNPIGDEQFLRIVELAQQAAKDFCPAP